MTRTGPCPTDAHSISVELVQGAQTTSADLDPLALTIDHYGNGLDIRQPTALGALLGVTYVMAKPWPFSAEITSYWHLELPLSRIS